jgi:hypothetical protein
MEIKKMAQFPFGNDPAKIEKYLAFWNWDDVTRPLVGFSFVGWFPMNEFAVCQNWVSSDYLTLEMVEPQDFMDDHVRLAREGEIIDDDMIRGACPTQVSIPFLPAMLGNPLRILPQNILGDERKLPWEEALAVSLDAAHPWYRKYMAFIDALVERAGGRFPVSHGPEIGPTDLHAILRGHNESIMDLVTAPQKSAKLLWHLGEIVRDLFDAIWQRIPLYHNGYFDAQYCLWSPRPIIRMQEDATAVYSPDLYRRIVQPVDRMLAESFSCNFMHLHSTSMFLLDAFLEIEEIPCFEINNDAVGPPIADMVPYFQQVQAAGRSLLIRGAFTANDMRLLMDSLESRGLFLNIMVKSMEEIEVLRPIVGM